MELLCAQDSKMLSTSVASQSPTFCSLSDFKSSLGAKTAGASEILQKHSLSIYIYIYIMYIYIYYIWLFIYIYIQSLQYATLASMLPSCSCFSLSIIWQLYLFIKFYQSIYVCLWKHLLCGPLLGESWGKSALNTKHKNESNHWGLTTRMSVLPWLISFHCCCSWTWICFSPVFSNT